MMEIDINELRIRLVKHYNKLITLLQEHKTIGSCISNDKDLIEAINFLRDDVVVIACLESEKENIRCLDMDIKYFIED